MIYIASPYSHPEKKVREERYQIVVGVTARLVAGGYNVYSPIIHSHPLVEYAEGHSNPAVARLSEKGHAFWMNYDSLLMHQSSGLIVVAIPGWDTSVGVHQEIKCFTDMHVAMALVSPEIITLEGNLNLHWVTNIPVKEPTNELP